MKAILPAAKGGQPSPRFIGLDLAKRQSQICVIDAHGHPCLNRRFDTTREFFVQLASELRTDDHVALEVTTNAFPIVRILGASPAEVVVSNPITTRLIAAAKLKTDKVDARKLAELLRVGYLPEVWIPDPDTEELRRLMFDRQSLVDRRTELKNRVHAVLHRELIPLTVADLFGPDGRRVLARLVRPPSGESACLSAFDQFRVAAALEEIDRLEEQIRGTEALVAAFICARPGWLERLDRVLSIPGVALVVGAGLLAAIGDPSRFSSGKRLASYCGLVPSTYQSGDAKPRHGRITKQGRALARWLAVEAAESLCRAHGPLRAFYQRLARKRGHNVAVVAVARKLMELIWTLLRKGEDYLYTVPRCAEEKRAAVRDLARSTGMDVPRYGKHGRKTPLNGSGARERTIKATIVQESAKVAERVYEVLIRERDRADREGLPPRVPHEAEGFDPTRPSVVDWQKVLERVAVTLSVQGVKVTRKGERRLGKLTLSDA